MCIRVDSLCSSLLTNQTSMRNGSGLLRVGECVGAPPSHSYLMVWIIWPPLWQLRLRKQSSLNSTVCSAVGLLTLYASMSLPIPPFFSLSLHSSFSSFLHPPFSFSSSLFSFTPSFVLLFSFSSFLHYPPLLSSSLPFPSLLFQPSPPPLSSLCKILSHQTLKLERRRRGNTQHTGDRDENVG